MKLNKSMKQLCLEKHVWKDKEEQPEHDILKSPKTPRTKPHFYHPPSTVPTIKNSHSHKHLLLSNQNCSHLLASPKYIPAKQLPKHNTHHQHHHSILAPINKNTSVQEQPKRPKILSKASHRERSFHEEFRLGKVLGKGRFGYVQMVMHNSTGSVYAAKQISLEKVTAKLVERLIAEIKIQSYLKHQNCLQLYKFYKEHKNLYLILEMGECSLFDMLRQKRFFTERETAHYIRQTTHALMYLHEHGIIHRDLKPENIVLVNGNVKLADFGWSIYTGNKKRTTFCGTLDYVSPQIVMGSEYDEMVDVWSVGVLCYELCTGNAPFESTKSRQETYRKILNVDLKFPKHLSGQIKDFIRRLLVRRPQARMSLEGCLSHPWLKQFQN